MPCAAQWLRCAAFVGVNYERRWRAGAWAIQSWYLLGRKTAVGPAGGHTKSWGVWSARSGTGLVTVWSGEVCSGAMHSLLYHTMRQFRQAYLTLLTLYFNCSDNRN